MAESIRLPVRVLVRGASTTVYTSWMSGPRADFTWPRVVESELHASGWPAEVRSLAVPAQYAKTFHRTWHVDALAWSPDVVVLDYGRMESIHLFIPRWFERHANSLQRRPFAVRQGYHRYLLKPFYRLIAKIQMLIDRSLPTTATLWRVRRGVKDIERLIERIRTVASPLVILPEIPPLGKNYLAWFPGGNARTDVMNEELKALARRFDTPDVRFVPLSAIWEPLVPEGGEVCPDGGHYTPEIHRAVGEELGRVALEWIEKQPHLLVETKPRE